MARIAPKRFGHASSRSALISPGKILRYFSNSEVEQLLSDWLSAYGANRHGVDVKSYLWHIFSAGCYPCSTGDAAIAEYKSQVATEFVVLSNDLKLVFLTDILPDSSSLSDYYVFPINMAWTMAFTHEDGWLGPYFARHSNFVQLNELNHFKLEKLREMNEAKLNGWC